MRRWRLHATLRILTPTHAPALIVMVDRDVSCNCARL